MISLFLLPTKTLFTVLENLQKICNCSDTIIIKWIIYDIICLVNNELFKFNVIPDSLTVWHSFQSYAYFNQKHKLHTSYKINKLMLCAQL